MKIVVIGGTGLIGSKTVAILRKGGHEVVAASPNTGVNTITGEGLKEAMAGTQVVIDLANSPSFEDRAVLEFFETSGRNLLAAEAAAGVRHHIALSIVGTDRTPDNGYFRAKVAQEKLIETSGIPYTIIRSTQFMEFLGGIAASSADGNIVRISPGLFQPIAADDVAAIVADVALAAPRNGIVEIAGPERAPFNEIVARYLKAVGEGSTFSFTYLRDHSCQADCDRREKANRVRKPGEPMRPVPMITIRRASVYSGTREAPC